MSTLMSPHINVLSPLPCVNDLGKTLPSDIQVVTSSKLSFTIAYILHFNVNQPKQRAYMSDYTNSANILFTVLAIHTKSHKMYLRGINNSVL